MDIIEMLNSSKKESDAPASVPTETHTRFNRPEGAQPTLESLPAVEDIAAQTLRKLYLRNRSLLAQISTDIEKLGEKILLDEGTRRIAERLGDTAFATALSTEVAAVKMVIEGKMSVVLTQKDELLEKKAEIAEELEHIRGPGRFARDAADRELELIQQDADLTKQLAEAVQRLKACQPLIDAINKLGLGSTESSSADGTYRLSQIVEELGEKQERVSALIAQLRQKEILTRTGKRGIYTAQERRIIVDVARSKSVSELSREWGNAVSTLKHLIEARLTEGTDYYNLGKGSQRDAYRVTPSGMIKLKQALSLTRARVQ
jgi:3-hydroxyacyl-CoA dehydrogenase